MIRLSEGIGMAAAVGLGVAFDDDVRKAFQDNRSLSTNDAAKIGNSFGSLTTVGPALAATWVVGKIIGEPKVSKAALWAAGSAAVAGVVTFGLKEAFGRTRPPGNDSWDFHPFSGAASFPSGHTSFAFGIASSLAHSTPDHWSDALFYSAATLTALSRINDDRHWLSDVVGGAAVGILAGRQLNLRARRMRVLATGGMLGVSVAIGSR